MSGRCPKCNQGSNDSITADERKGRFVCSECGYDTWSSPFQEVTKGSKKAVFTPVTAAPLEKEIREECMLLADFLVEKNRAYGNSASEPCRIFAKRVDPLAQIDVRIDDKLSRLLKGQEFPGDNDIKDLTGYLILRMIVEKKQKKDGEQ